MSYMKENIACTLNLMHRSRHECTPLYQTALIASWLYLTSSPSGVTWKENATAEWASAILDVREAGTLQKPVRNHNSLLHVFDLLRDQQ